MNSKGEDSNKVVIRPFSLNDYAPLLALWDAACLPYRPQGRDSKASIASQIQQPNTLYLVAEQNNQMVGAVFGTHDGRKGWINRLAVLPSHQRQGIARHLVEELEQRFSAIGIDIVACLIEDWNHDSIAAFKKLGYLQHKDIFYFSKRKNEQV